jgi:hypothetical protein
MPMATLRSTLACPARDRWSRYCCHGNLTDRFILARAPIFLPVLAVGVEVTTRRRRAVESAHQLALDC